MNFLAHLLLSGENEAVIMGNYVGDFVKGRLTEEKTTDWNREYLVGLRLHRFIDMYTDAHPIVRDAKHKVAEIHGKVAGIIIDIYFDYFLAKNFSDFCKETLWEYSHRMYSVIGDNEHLVPEHMIPMVKSMIRQDWLNSYDTFEGIDLTFNRMSHRADFMVSLKTAVGELKRNEQYYEDSFRRFFPELENQCIEFLGGNLA